MATPTTTNPTATVINTGIKLAGGTIVSVVEALICADVPWLALPIIKPLWQAVLNWIAGYYIKAAENGATFAVIDRQVKTEETALSDALSALIDAEVSNDPIKIKKAIQDYAAAHALLIHDDGSAVSH
jgi:hypothetical protein